MLCRSRWLLGRTSVCSWFGQKNGRRKGTKSVALVCFLEEQIKSKTLSEEIRRPYEKCSAVPLEALLKLAGKRVNAVHVKVIVIPDVECRTRTRRICEQKLAGEIVTQRVVIQPRPCEKEPRELIRGPDTQYVRVKGPDPIVISYEAAL